MEISEEEVLKIASLGRISLSQEDLPLFQQEFSKVLSYFSKIDQLESSFEEDFRTDLLGNPTLEREDKASSSQSVERLLETAPSVKGQSFAVPRIFE